jgi:hypothetical protein
MIGMILFETLLYVSNVFTHIVALMVHTICTILVFPDFAKAVELVVSLRCALQSLGVSASLVQVWILALFLRDLLMYLVEAIADHFDFLPFFPARLVFEARNFG